MDSVQKTESKGMFFKIGKFREVGLLVFIIIVSIIIDIRNPAFLTLSNISDLMLDTSILSILAIGMMLVIATRGVDLSIGSTLALTGMIVGLTVIKHQNISPSVVLLMGIVIGIILGSVTGFIIAKGNVPPIIATLGMMNVYRGITFIISQGRWVNAHQMPASFKALSRDSFLGINNLVIFAIISYIVFYYFINHTRTGRHIFAVGSNPEAAMVTGINNDRILLLVYTIMGALSGLCGVLWISRYASAQNDTAVGFEMFVIAACVIGGVSISGGSGKISGLILGSLFIGIVNNALPIVKISPFWKLAIQGIVILFAVLVNVIIMRNVTKKNLMRRKI